MYCGYAVFKMIKMRSGLMRRGNSSSTKKAGGFTKMEKSMIYHEKKYKFPLFVNKIKILTTFRTHNRWIETPVRVSVVDPHAVMILLFLPAPPPVQCIAAAVVGGGI